MILKYLFNKEDPPYTPETALHESTMSELIGSSIVYILAVIFLIRVCDGPRFVISQVVLILFLSLANMGRIVFIRRFFKIDETMQDVLSATFGFIYYSADVIVYWNFVFKYYTTSTKVNQIIAKHAEAMRNEGRVSEENWIEKVKKEKRQRVLAMKRHLKQQTKECKAWIYVVLVVLVVLGWMIVSLTIGTRDCRNGTAESGAKCEFERWMGNSMAYLVMESILSIFRLTTVIVFQIALMNFWRALKSSTLIKQEKRTFILHWILLVAYTVCEIVSLTLVMICNFTDQMSEQSSTLWFINSMIWCIDNSTNFIAILVVLDRINNHYQKVKKLERSQTKEVIEEMKKFIEHSHGSNGLNDPDRASNISAMSISAPVANPMVQRALERKLVDEAITNIFLIKAQRRSVIREGLQADHMIRRTTFTNLSNQATRSPVFCKTEGN